jgi:hypothetical protein
MSTITQHIESITENATAVATLAEADLAREVVYVSRARVMATAIKGVFAAMDQLECSGTSAGFEFNDDWRAVRLRLALAQSRMEAVISGAGDSTLPPCQATPRRSTNSRHWQ